MFIMYKWYILAPLLSTYMFLRNSEAFPTRSTWRPVFVGLNGQVLALAVRGGAIVAHAATFISFEVYGFFIISTAQTTKGDPGICHIHGCDILTEDIWHAMPGDS